MTTTERRPRRPRLARATLLLVSEAVAVAVLHSLGQFSWMQIDWGDLSTWVDQAPAEDVLLASVRMVALVLAWWLLVSTALYVAAVLAGAPQALRSIQWALIPGVRRGLDGLLAMSVTSSALLTTTAAAAGPSTEAVVATPEGTRITEKTPDEIAFKMAIYQSGASLAQPEPEVPTYVVQAGDSLWEIAESQLGDPSRWDEIFEANRSRLEAAGHTDPNMLLIGWELVLPGEEPSRAPSASRAGSDDGTAGTSAGGDDELTAGLAEVTVEPGDHFWAIARERLEDEWQRPAADHEIGPYWVQVVDANRDRLAPPGDPDLIYPGQQMVLPTPPADPLVPSAPGPDVEAETDAEPPATGGPHTPPPANDGRDGKGSEADDQQSEPGSASDDSGDDPVADQWDDANRTDGSLPNDPEDGVASTDDAMPDDPRDNTPAEDDPLTDPGDANDQAATEVPPGTTPTHDAPSDQPVPPDDANTEPAAKDTDTESTNATSRLPIGLVAGGIGVAGLLLLLERARRAQQRRRRRGERIALPGGELADLETELREGADLDGARFVDIALRAAAAGAGASGLPLLRWVEATPDDVLVVLSEPVPPPPGFVSEGPGRWRSDLPIEGLASLGAQTASPAPMLCPVGTTAEGAEVLVDLEAYGVLAVKGDENHVAAWLRAVALTVATAPWTVQPQVFLVGWSSGIGALPSVDAEELSFTEALERAEAHTEHIDAMLRSLSCATTAQARASGATPDAWEPLLVLSMTEPHDLDEHRLVGLTSRRGNGTAVVCPHRAASPAGSTCTIDTSGLLRLDGVDTVVMARQLSEPDARAIELLDHAAGAEAAPPEPTPAPVSLTPEPARRTQTPDAPEHLDDLLTDVDVLIRVLGEVRIVRRTAAGDEPMKVERQKGAETLCYLAMREDTVDRQDLEAALFPAGANSLRTVQNAVTAARRAVGDRLFPAPEGGQYTLSERLATDYSLFANLTQQADEVDDPEQAASLLAEALALVTGEPFTGAGRGYNWIGPHRAQIIAEVVDAADELAEIRLATGDWRGAEWAARKGLRAFPWDERMHRILMRCAAAAGNAPGVHRAYEELVTALTDSEHAVEPDGVVQRETIELLEELTTKRSGRASA